MKDASPATEGRAEGELTDKARAVLAVLESRGLTVLRNERRKILAMRNESVLDGWLTLAAACASPSELFEIPRRRRRRG